MYRPFSQQVTLYHPQLEGSGSHGIGGGSPFIYRKNVKTNDWDFYPVLTAIDTVFETELYGAHANFQFGFYVNNAEENEFIVLSAIYNWEKSTLNRYCLAIAKEQDGIIQSYAQMLGSCSKMTVNQVMKLSENTAIYPTRDFIFFGRGDSLGVYDRNLDTLILYGVHKKDGKITALHVQGKTAYTVYELENILPGRREPIYTYYFGKIDLSTGNMVESCQIRADGRKRWYAFDRATGHLLDVYNEGVRLHFDYYKVE